jgi:D-tyrosyl-tRNA(Tyr) deacylase
MRILVQRVKSGSVRIDGKEVGAIELGLVVLVGVAKGDTEAMAEKLARKTAALRIFADEAGKLNLSLKDIGGQALAVSQFTLYADTSRGNRPGFDQAAPPQLAERLYEHFVRALREQGITVQTGVFQAYMLVSIENDGPVTLMLEDKEREV